MYETCSLVYNVKEITNAESVNGKIRGRLSKGETDVAMRSPLLQPLINWCPDLGGWCWCFIVSTFLFVQEKCQKLVIFELRMWASTLVILKNLFMECPSLKHIFWPFFAPFSRHDLSSGLLVKSSVPYLGRFAPFLAHKHQLPFCPQYHTQPAITTHNKNI